MKQSSHRKNVLYLSLSFFFVFLAFSSTQNLESNVTTNRDIGTTSLSVLYVGLFMGSFVAPPVVSTLGIKRSIVLGLSTYVIFSAANLHESWFTLIPTGFIVGLGASVSWTAQGEFLTQSAKGHARIRSSERTSKSFDHVLSELSGIFYTIFQCTQVFGNALAYVVFSMSEANKPEDQMNLLTLDSFHPNGTTDTVDVKLSANTKLILFSLFTVSASIGCIISAVFVSNPADVVHPREDEEEFEIPNVTPTPPRRPYLRKEYTHSIALLIPLFAYSGSETSFIFGSFTADLVKPSIGEKYVPLLMVCFGFTNVVTSFLCSKLVSRRSQIRLVMPAAGLIHLSMLSVMLYKDNEHHFSDFWLVLISSLWGVGDAIINTLLTALLGIRFKGEYVAKAFAQFKAWQSLSAAISFLMQLKFKSNQFWIIVVANIVLCMIAITCFLMLGCQKQRSVVERDNLTQSNTLDSPLLEAR